MRLTGLNLGLVRMNFLCLAAMSHAHWIRSVGGGKRVGSRLELIIIHFLLLFYVHVRIPQFL